MSYTKGPWTIAPCSDRDETRDVVAGYAEIQEEGRTIKQAHWICELDACVGFDSDVEAQYAEMEANARLIAAAPTMYEALRGVASWLESFSMPPTATAAEKQEQIAIINAALAKAEGQES